MTQVEKTKDNILKAAQDEFAAKGYEKARMEDIAARAGVTKMMLYYHFSSKENILQAISEDILAKAGVSMHKELLSIINIKKPDPELIKNKIKQLVEPNSPLLQFMVREFVKGSLDYKMAFNILKSFYDRMLELFQARGIKIRDKEQYYLRLFFFQSVPLLIYFSFKEQYTEVFNIDGETADKVFFAKFTENIANTLKGPLVK
ncbi:MAG: helix-turn-helix domain containing protein [Spirochaetia bacterium]